MERDYIPGTDYIIFQDRRKFSFGVDAVLLSDFAKIKPEDTVLDIGAGTGIVGLRIHALYQPKKIYAVEIQEKVAELCARSIAANGLEEKIHLIVGDLNRCGDDFEDGALDVIVSNPPYVKKCGGILNEDDNQRISRQEVTLSLEDVFAFAHKKLKHHGSLYMIHRPARLVDVLSTGRAYQLEPKRMRMIQSKEGAAPTMVLVAFRHNGGAHFDVDAPLIIYNPDGSYTEEVLSIYGTCR